MCHIIPNDELEIMVVDNLLDRRYEGFHTGIRAQFRLIQRSIMLTVNAMAVALRQATIFTHTHTYTAAETDFVFNVLHYIHCRAQQGKTVLTRPKD